MREFGGPTETWRAGVPVAVGGTILLPIGRIVRHASVGEGHAWCSFALEPLAVLVRDANGISVLGARGAVSIAELRDRVPGLDALLASL